MLSPESGVLGIVSASRGPWTVAAVSVSAIALLLLLYGLSIVPSGGLVAWYALSYLIVGMLMMGPNIKAVSTTTLVFFSLPGLLMVALWVLGAGYWGGLWLLGLPAWAIICQRWNQLTKKQKTTQPVLLILALMASSLMFIISGFYVPNFSAFLLPLLPIVLAVSSPSYRAQPWRAISEALLAAAVIVTSLLLPDLGWGSPVGFAGGAVLAALLLALWAGRGCDETLAPEPKTTVA